MPVQIPAQFNNLSAANIDQNVQQSEYNALRNDSLQQQTKQRGDQFSEDQHFENLEFLADSMEQVIANPNLYGEWAQELDRRGIPIPDNKQFEPQEFAQKLEVIKMKLAGQEQPDQYEDVMNDDGVFVGQRNASNNKYDPIGASAKGPSSPMQNYEYRVGLVDKFGDKSPQVKTFDSYVRAQKVTDIAGVPTSVGPGGNEPLSTLDAESDAAAQLALVEGEGGRGRVQGPDGSFAPVPGTEADVKQQEAERKRSGGAFMKSIQSQTVIEDVDRLNQQIEADLVPFGRQAAIQKDLPPVMQTDGYRNASSLIESVKGNVGIDSLLRIKATGAGLGHVPQSQLDLLSRLLGELDMNQSKEQFVRTWDRMGFVYEIIMEQADDELYELDVERPDVSGGGGGDDAKLQQARDAIAAGRSRAAVVKMLEDAGIDASKL